MILSISYCLQFSLHHQYCLVNDIVYLHVIEMTVHDQISLWLSHINLEKEYKILTSSKLDISQILSYRQNYISTDMDL